MNICINLIYLGAHFENGMNSCVRNLSIWYPDQHYSSDTIHVYPYTIDSDNAWGYSVMNVTLYNSYKGIRIRVGSAVLLSNIYGTVLKKGITVGFGWEYPYFYNLVLGNSVWKNAPNNIITNSPKTTADRNALDNYTTTNLTGIHFGQNDALEAYNLSVKDAYKDILLKKITYPITDDHGVYGVFSKITGHIDEVDTYPNIHYINTDKVSEVSSMSYTFATMKKTTKSDLYNVKSFPYNAVGNGIVDDTNAIQSALTECGNSGGGIVFLPPGQYKVCTHLTVPSNVELRGPYGAPHTAELNDLCVLLVYEGKGTDMPNTDKAFITLSENSGVRGFTIFYPEQGYGGTGRHIVSTYPYTIRGDGSGIWIVDMNLKNPYNAIDFATNRCDNFLINGLWSIMLNFGICVGGNSTGGVIERASVSYGNWYQTYNYNAPHNYGKSQIINYTKGHVCPYIFGNCTNITSFGLNSYNVFVGWRSVGNITNSTFWHSSSDTVGNSCYLFEGGNNINFIGMAAGGAASYWIRTTSQFTGTVNVYGRYNWANTEEKNIIGGEVNFYNEKSLTSNKPAWARTEYSANEKGLNALDGKEGTKWVSGEPATISNPQWLRIDLGQPCEINRWFVKNAQVNGEAFFYNTYNLQLQVSDDGINFTAVDGVDNNTGVIIHRDFSTVKARYVRLVVYVGTQPGYDNYVRFPELLVFGRNGWHFTTGVQGWTAFNQISGFAFSDGKLTFISTGNDPSILSEDNLGIDLTNFKKVKICFKNSTSSTGAQLFFTTNASPSFSEAKSAIVTTITNDPVWTEYTFDFSSNSSWAGTLKQLRFDPTDSIGNISIDYIVLSN